MELTLQHPGEHLFIRSVSEQGIQIDDALYTDSIIVSASEVFVDWPVSSANEITESTLEPILELEPEIVLIGTGSKQLFLPPQLMVFIYQHNAGLEVMTSDAACRTFNVLVSEGRKVVAALLPVI